MYMYKVYIEGWRTTWDGRTYDESEGKGAGEWGRNLQYYCYSAIVRTYNVQYSQITFKIIICPRLLLPHDT